MRNFHAVLCLFLLALGLSACADVKKVDYAAPLTQPEDAHPAPLGWSSMKVTLPTGKDIGSVAYNDTFVPFCGLPILPAHRTLFKRAIDETDVRNTFRETLGAVGYDIVGTLDYQFPEDFDDDEDRAEYRIGAHVIDVQVGACYTEPHLNPFTMEDHGFQGELYLKVQWSLWDALRRKVVYKTISEGYSKLHDANQEGLTLMVTDAFGMAAHNLGAQKDFHDLIFYGTQPAENGLKKSPKKERPRIFNPEDQVTIHNPRLSTTPFTSQADDMRKAAVMIQTAWGHGSGFFITDDGYILTNAHVVGEALRVRVTPANKKKAMTAEVLRRDKIKDVALLKIEELPEDFKITTLPIRAEWPKVSEPVFVIGTPLVSKLQDTITSGIVSAHRKNYRIMGTRMNLIQADVMVQGGNSGGPMLDEFGNLIGITDASFLDRSEYSISINLFIPIAEALTALKIDLIETDAPQPLTP